MLFFPSLFLLFRTKQAKDCKFATAQGTYDLSSIAGVSYSYQWAGDYFELSICDNVAASTKCSEPISDSCAIQDHGGNCYSLGTWDTSYTLTSANNSLTVEFVNGATSGCTENNKAFPRSITYVFQCNEDEEVRIVGVGEYQTCYYIASIGTKYVCNNHIIPTSPPSAGGLSDGSIFLISLLAFVTVYCFAGFGFNKYRRSAEGFQAFPQSSFWCKQLPFWVKTGCMVSWAFTVRLFVRIRAKITGVNPVNRGREDTDADGQYENLD